MAPRPPHGWLWTSCKSGPFLSHHVTSSSSSSYFYLLTHAPRTHRYVVLKVHVTHVSHFRELEVLQYLKSIQSEHSGREQIRLLEDHFTIQGSCGPHIVFVLPPLGVSVKHLQELQPGGVYDEETAVSAIQRTVLALNFLHHEASVIHTGKSYTTLFRLGKKRERRGRRASTYANLITPWRRSRWKPASRDHRRVSVISVRRKRTHAPITQEGHRGPCNPRFPDAPGCWRPTAPL